MAYRLTLQAQALKLVAKKLQSSLAVEGELPENGLAVHGDDGDDLLLALARQIVNNDIEDESVTQLLADARAAEDEAEELLLAAQPIIDAAPEISVTVTVPEPAPEPTGLTTTTEAWADWLTAPPKKRRTKRNPPASQSLFAWAMGGE